MLLCQQHMDGHPDLTTWGTAVLFGTTTAELGEWVDLDSDPAAADKLPGWLIQQGQRRSKEAQAITENATATAILTHWAVRDFGAGALGFDMTMTEDVCQLWMIAETETIERLTGNLTGLESVASPATLSRVEAICCEIYNRVNASRGAKWPEEGGIAAVAMALDLLTCDDMSYSRHIVDPDRTSRLCLRKGGWRTMASVHDVAAYILSKRNGMSTMKLQKLCYYSQGWALAWDEQPLFDEPIRAWANGPVVYELYDKHRGQFRVGRHWPHGDSENLKAFEKETIDAVLRSYGGLSGQQLSDKTHAEPPWVLARRGTQEGALSTAEISLQAMQEYFGALAHKEAVALEEDDAVEDEAEVLELEDEEDGDDFYTFEPSDDYYAAAEYADLESDEDEDADFDPSDLEER